MLTKLWKHLTIQHCIWENGFPTHFVLYLSPKAPLHTLTRGHRRSKDNFFPSSWCRNRVSECQTSDGSGSKNGPEVSQTSDSSPWQQTAKTWGGSEVLQEVHEEEEHEEGELRVCGGDEEAVEMLQEEDGGNHGGPTNWAVCHHNLSRAENSLQVGSSFVWERCLILSLRVSTFHILQF